MTTVEALRTTVTALKVIRNNLQEPADDRQRAACAELARVIAVGEEGLTLGAVSPLALEEQSIEAFVERVNARAEAEMLAGRSITGAHHRAIEYELARLRAGRHE